MTDFASTQRNSRRGVGIVVVLIFHVLLVWGIHSGLARQFVKVITGPVEAVLLEEKKPEIPPPPPPPPPKNLPPPPPPAYVPPADVPVNNAPAAVNAIAAVSATPPPPATPVVVAPAPPAPPPPAPANIRASASLVNCPEPTYPSASRREEEEGSGRIKVIIGVDGKALRTVVEKSSGYKRLDEAASNAFNRCTFKPATLDGKPIEGEAFVPFKFKLE